MDITEFSRLDDQGHYSRHPWEISRKDVLLSLLRSSEVRLPVQRIVDIGSGDAYVIHTLLERGLAQEYFAIDTAYTPDVIEQLKKNNAYSQVNYVYDLKEYFEKFNDDNIPTLFLCMDVLEHLPDEKIILDYLTQRNGNYFFFAVPAFQSVFSDHDVLLGHYRRYTLGQLENVLKSGGFEIRDKGYYFTSLLIFRWIDKILNKDKKASIDNWKGAPWKSNVITTILKIDVSVAKMLKKLGLHVHGLSCYCLCKK